MKTRKEHAKECQSIQGGWVFFRGHRPAGGAEGARDGANLRKFWDRCEVEQRLGMAQISPESEKARGAGRQGRGSQADISIVRFWGNWNAKRRKVFSAME